MTPPQHCEISSPLTLSFFHSSGIMPVYKMFIINLELKGHTTARAGSILKEAKVVMFSYSIIMLGIKGK